MQSPSNLSCRSWKVLSIHPTNLWFCNNSTLTLIISQAKIWWSCLLNWCPLNILPYFGLFSMIQNELKFYLLLGNISFHKCLPLNKCFYSYIVPFRSSYSKVGSCESHVTFYSENWKLPPVEFPFFKSKGG